MKYKILGQYRNRLEDVLTPLTMSKTGKAVALAVAMGMGVERDAKVWLIFGQEIQETVMINLILEIRRGNEWRVCPDSWFEKVQ